MVFESYPKVKLEGYMRPSGANVDIGVLNCDRRKENVFEILGKNMTEKVCKKN